MNSIYLRLVLATLFWGGTFVAGRMLARELEPFTAAFLRFALASLVLLPLMLRAEHGFPELSGRQWFAVFLLGLTGVFAYNFFFFQGLQTVEAGRAALIIAGNPVFIALFSFIFFSERLNALQLSGVLVSVLGAMTVISRGEIGTLIQGQIGSGELYLVGCVFSWVAYTLIGRKVLTGVTPLTAVALSAVVGSLLLLPFSLAHNGLVAIASVSITAWISLTYLALLGTALGFIWFYQGVVAIGPSRAGQFINLVPVSGLTLGILLLGERFTPSLFAGGALVLGGLWLTNRR